jgi:hypothetical protein
MNLLALYKAILLASGAIVSDEGLVSISRPEHDPIFCMVNGKRLALPTEELLKSGAFNPDKALIGFHPMCENVVLETSPVLAQLETLMTYRLTWTLRELLLQLVAIAANPKLHGKMKVPTHGLLSAMPNADDRTNKDFTKILESTSVVGPKKLITLYVRHGGVYGGDKVSRLARFFPAIVDALDQEKRTLLNVHLRIADVPAFLALLEYVLPEYRDADRYASPSNSLVAPSFHALVRTFGKVANQLNKIIDIHATHLSDIDSLRIDTSWLDSVHDLSSYRETIPVLPGNDGAEGTKAVRGATAIKTPQAPVACGVTATRGPGTAVSVDDVVRAMAPPTRTAFGGFQYPANHGISTRGFRAQQNDNLPSWARDQRQVPWGGNQGGGGFRRAGGRTGSGRL